MKSIYAKTGVDVPKFKKWLSRNIGKKCKSRDVGCICCNAWIIFEDMAELIKEIEELEAWANGQRPNCRLCGKPGMKKGRGRYRRICETCREKRKKK